MKSDETNAEGSSLDIVSIKQQQGGAKAGNNSRLLALCLGLSVILNCGFAICYFYQVRTANDLKSTVIDPSYRDRVISPFVLAVTYHLLDNSYWTLDRNANALRTELLPGIITRLQSEGKLPHSKAELESKVRMAVEKKTVATVQIQNMLFGKLDDKGFIPADVSGFIAMSTLGEPPIHWKPFHFKYLIGIYCETKKPIVATLEEVSD